MKINILAISLLVLLNSTLATAQKAKPLSLQFSLQCVTEFPTTSFLSFLKGNELKIKLVNHNGYSLMPISSGLLTSNDIALISRRSEILKPLGNEAWLTFNTSNCTSYQDQSLSCFGSKSIEVNGQPLPIMGVGLSVSFITSQIMDQSVREVQVSARLRAPNFDDPDHEVTMRYSPTECRIQL